MNQHALTAPERSSSPDCVVEIRITPDGRVLFHDLLAQLLPVAATLSPDDPSLVARARAAAAFDRTPAS